MKTSGGDNFLEEQMLKHAANCCERQSSYVSGRMNQILRCNWLPKGVPVDALSCPLRITRFVRQGKNSEAEAGSRELIFY